MTNITNIDRTAYVPCDDPHDEAGAPFWEDVPQAREPIVIRVKLPDPPKSTSVWPAAVIAISWTIIAVCFAVAFLG